MAKGKNVSGTVGRAAEVMGGAIGSIAGKIDALQAQHPDPVGEARAALAAGQETLSAVASEAGARAATVVRKTKAAARRAKKVVKRAQAKGKAVVRRGARKARKAVGKTKKVVTKGPKRAGGKKTAKKKAR